MGYRSHFDAHTEYIHVCDTNATYIYIFSRNGVGAVSDNKNIITQCVIIFVNVIIKM